MSNRLHTRRIGNQPSRGSDGDLDVLAVSNNTLLAIAIAAIVVLAIVDKIVTMIEHRNTKYVYMTPTPVPPPFAEQATRENQPVPSHGWSSPTTTE